MFEFAVESSLLFHHGVGAESNTRAKQLCADMEKCPFFSRRVTFCLRSAHHDPSLLKMVYSKRKKSCSPWLGVQESKDRVTKVVSLKIRLHCRPLHIPILLYTMREHENTVTDI